VDLGNHLSFIFYRFKGLKNSEKIPEIPSTSPTRTVE
jgi:hypothetical protein